MSKAAILVDFHNIFGGEITNPTKIEFALNEIVQDALAQGDIDEIILRLYDGWYEGVVLSHDASKIMSKLHDIAPIPPIYGNKLIRGQMEYAKSLFGDDFILYNTCRHTKGPRLSLSASLKDDVCNRHNNNCAISLVKRLTKSKTKFCSVGGCSKKNEDVLVQYGQKMVDNMICCDILTIGNPQERTQAIYVLSDDVDVYPALVLCRKNNKSIKLFIGLKHSLDEKKNTDKNILEQFSIKPIKVNYDDTRI